VINLRGTIIPIVDMAKRFGMKPVTLGRQTRIIIARIADQSVGLIVEMVTEVINLPEKSIEPAPRMAFSVDTRYVEGVGHISEGLLIILNLDLLLSLQEMSQLQQNPLS
jgi:purine-binding chemotaxis protein CheW